MKLSMLAALAYSRIEHLCLFPQAEFRNEISVEASIFVIGYGFVANMALATSANWYEKCGIV